ncbi:MAG: 30S ribosomal protein S20 [Eubacteriaceae bacterium]|jgi:small subunit ribosomal protein S20|nr:30S ribosomal protein S20 [Eubacteriaceae bacterium]
MANIKSAKKRILTSEKNRLRNKAVKTNLKTTEKRFQAAILGGSVEEAENALRLTSKKYDMAASKGIIHKNVANRKKAQIAKKLGAMKAGGQQIQE